MIRKLLWPAVMTAAMLVVLLGLGTWQVRRLAWKQAILAQIAHAEAAAPVPLPATPGTPIPPPFTKVAVTGTLMHDRSALYAAEVRDTRAGPELGALPDRAAAACRRPARAGRSRLGAAQAQGAGGDAAGRGHHRRLCAPATTPGLFSAPDDVAGRHFYTLDPGAIGAALGLDHVAPFILIALAAPPPPGMPPRAAPGRDAPGGADPGGAAPGGAPGAAIELPIPAEHLPRPPNNHLAYAITWYGLAAALLVIFVVWARKAVHA